MVPKEKLARKYYDKLLSLAPLNRCPYCGIGQVSTLDHYLPKTKFLIFSVLPYNLVASCKDCNTGKLDSYATTQNKQTLHPYYDDFTSEQWLYARVLQPLKIEFYVLNKTATVSSIAKRFDIPYTTTNRILQLNGRYAFVKEYYENYHLYNNQ